MVAPFMISGDEPLSTVSGGFNAVEVLGEPIGRVMFYGPGAGAGALWPPFDAEAGFISAGSVSG